MPRVAREENAEWGDSLAETSRVPASGRDGCSVHRREPYRAVGLRAPCRNPVVASDLIIKQYSSRTLV